MIMPDIMTSIDEDGGRVSRAEVLGVQRRRRWTPQEKVRIVDETYLPGHSVSLVARRHGTAANQLFAWRRLMAQGALTAAGAGEEVVPASQYRALESQVRGLQRLLGKKTMENEVLREAVTRAAGSKNCYCARARGRKGAQRAPQPLPPEFRARISPATLHGGPPRRRGRPPLPDGELVASIGALISDLPTYGYRREHTLLRRRAKASGRAAPNPKRVYRVMNQHGVLLQRIGIRNKQRRHDGRVAVDTSNTRWCSDGLEIACLRPRLLRSGSDRLCRYECRD